MLSVVYLYRYMVVFYVTTFEGITFFRVETFRFRICWSSVIYLDEFLGRITNTPLMLTSCMVELCCFAYSFCYGGFKILVFHVSLLIILI